MNASDLFPVLQAALQQRGSTRFSREPVLHPKAPWRPHLREDDNGRAWEIVTFTPQSDAWAVRLQATRNILGDLALGICAPLALLQMEHILEIVDELHAAILVPDVPRADGSDIAVFYHSAADFIYERDLALSVGLARRTLDRAWARAIAETDTHRKGVLLEVALALVFSQVEGFRVTHKGISSRNQQIDVSVDNARGSGPCSGSIIVIGEAKNWASPVSGNEYLVFREKLAARRGRCKLGYLVTTDRFTAGATTASIRDSKFDLLIVMLDGERFPRIWREHDTVTIGVEAATRDAIYDPDTE